MNKSTAIFMTTMILLVLLLCIAIILYCAYKKKNNQKQLDNSDSVKRSNGIQFEKTLVLPTESEIPRISHDGEVDKIIQKKQRNIIANVLDENNEKHYTLTDSIQILLFIALKAHNLNEQSVKFIFDINLMLQNGEFDTNNKLIAEINKLDAENHPNKIKKLLQNIKILTKFEKFKTDGKRFEGKNRTMDENIIDKEKTSNGFIKIAALSNENDNRNLNNSAIMIKRILKPGRGKNKSGEISTKYFNTWIYKTQNKQKQTVDASKSIYTDDLIKHGKTTERYKTKLLAILFPERYGKAKIRRMDNNQDVTLVKTFDDFQNYSDKNQSWDHLYKKKDVAISNSDLINSILEAYILNIYDRSGENISKNLLHIDLEDTPIAFWKYNTQYEVARKIEKDAVILFINDMNADRNIYNKLQTIKNSEWNKEIDKFSKKLVARLQENGIQEQINQILDEYEKEKIPAINTSDNPYPNLKIDGATRQIPPLTKIDLRNFAANNKSLSWYIRAVAFPFLN